MAPRNETDIPLDAKAKVKKAKVEVDAEGGGCLMTK
jgi:hypothetical protein